tara:strand:+ start:1919 stop:2104 length:186 start_codon:yes stop_codon:yes gene_type:complete
MKPTKQDKQDIVKTINLLDETSSYIESLVGKNNLEQHHKNMFDAIDVANEWLERLEKGELK